MSKNVRRSTLAWVVVLMMMFTLLMPINAFAVNQQNNNIPVTGVTILHEAVSIHPNTLLLIIPSVSPWNATNRNVTFQSAHPDIATVDAQGLIRGIAAGTTTVTVTTVDGGFTATTQVVVNPLGGQTVNIPVTGVTLSPETVSIHPNTLYRVTPNVSPGNATNRNVTFQSAHPHIATVNAQGWVRGIAAGTTTVTATTVDGGFTATTQVVVNPLGGQTVNSWEGLRTAINAAPANQPTTINVVGNINSSAASAIAIPTNRQITLVGDEGVRRINQTNNRQRHFTIASGATLTLGNNIILCGSMWNGGGVQVNAGGTLTMNEGSVIENAFRQDVGGGVALSGSGSAERTRATLNLNGGIIRNNAGTNGGGVHLGTNSVVNMTAGSIEGNRSTSTSSGAGGGGVMLNASTAVFNMTDGTIRNNRAATGTRANAGGGGVRVTNGTFTMSGGARIENNESTGTAATSGGGGIHQSGGRVHVNGGTITGNRSENQGGGVYVAATTVGAFTMTGGSIINNTARMDGGGIFSTQANHSLTVPTTAYRNLQIGGGVAFTGNVSRGASMPPNNRLAHIVTTSSSIFDYVLNNHDINYTGRLGQTESGVTSWAALRAEIAAAPVNLPTRIQIAGNFSAPTGSAGNAIVIPANRNIILVSNEGSRRILTSTTGQRHFTIASGATLTLENNITLRGDFNNSGGVQVNAGGTLVMNQGSIIEDCSRSTVGGGVALSGSGSAVGNRATLTMNGGLIRNNSATNGGGVHLGTNSVVNMSSGSIENNRTHSTASGAGGGGVMLNASTAVFNMTGGTIINNRSNTSTRTNAGGGGVRVSNGTFNISGQARIENNQASSALAGMPLTSGGGGIYQSGGRINMTGGAITGNTSDSQGGGVMVATSTAGAFTMTGGSITNNTARVDGGGVFSSQSNNSLTVPATAYRNLQIGGAALFSDNRARGASAPPNNRLAHITATSSSIWDYVLNNYDINYTGRLGQRP